MSLVQGVIEIAGIRKDDTRICGLTLELGGERVEGILGRDMMKDFKLTIDWRNCVGQLAD